MSPGLSSSQGRAEKPAGPDRDAAACQVLLAGPEALAIRGDIEKILPPGSSTNAVASCESILEAVLMSGGGGRSGDVPLILAGIAQEIEQIEPAVRSMRKVYPASRIVLLCEPGDEVLCRKAKNWGATDYLILPPDTNLLRRLLAGPPSPPPPTPTLRKPPRNGQPAPAVESPPNPIAPAALLQKVVEVPAAPTAPASPTHDSGATAQHSPLRTQNSKLRTQNSELRPQNSGPPALPLMVQSTLFQDLLLGRADFADCLVATLQAHLRWEGTLKFLPADPAPAATTPAAPADSSATDPSNTPSRATVALPHQPPLGTLLLDRPAVSPLSTQNSELRTQDSELLREAADWLAALLTLARRHDQLRSLAITDELSGAYNRRYFTRFMSGLLERARQNRFRVTLLVFDIDDFKKYNDTFGHVAGDAIIRELIKLLRACTRREDLVARLGGDEFAAVFWDNEAPRQPNSEHPRDAISATERFRKAIQTHQWHAACNIKGEVSVSGGLATFPWDADNFESLLTRADEALLKAKAAGKNVFLLHGEKCPQRGP